MVKRVKVIEKPKVHSMQVFCGAEARQEGRGVDDIEYTLLRTPDLKASWLQGWKERDAELAAKKVKRK